MIDDMVINKSFAKMVGPTIPSSRKIEGSTASNCNSGTGIRTKWKIFLLSLI